MRIAKAKSDDIKMLSQYLLKNEQRSGKNSRQFPHGWRRVIMAAEVLIDNCCDPTEETLQFSPYLEEFHVAPEQ